MLLVHVTPCAASPAPTPSSGTPPQNCCSATQMLSPGPEWREEVDLWFVAVSWFLFQFNLQACWFLAVPLRYFKATPGFSCILYQCLSDWFSDLFWVLQFGINVAFLFQWVAVEAKRNVYLLASLYRYRFKEKKPKWASCSLSLLTLNSVLFVLHLQLEKRTKTSCEQNPLLVSIFYFLCVVLHSFPYSLTA